MANKLIYKRGTAAGLAALASSNGLIAAEPYYITDQGRIAIGKSANTYETFVKSSEFNVLAGSYVGSRGENLVTNGSALMGNNYNFSSFVFNGADAYSGGGSFRITSSAQIAIPNDEYLPVNTDYRYRLSAYGRWESGTQQPTWYLGVACYDVDKTLISPANTMRQFDDVLAAPLTVGDTTIKVASPAGWNNTASAALSHLRTVVVWGYRNSFGYTYPPYTYSRFNRTDAYDIGGVDVPSGTITLRTPWNYANPDPASGGVWPAGTPLSNGSSGGTYKYIATNAAGNPLGSTWQSGSGTIQSVDTSGTNSTPKFHPGTAFVRLFFLMNYTVSTLTSSLISNVEFALDTRGGPGSGLDSDTVDGFHGADLAKLSGNVFTGANSGPSFTATGAVAGATVTASTSMTAPSFIGLATRATALQFTDSRAVTPTPGAATPGITYDFKSNAASLLADGGSYSGLVTFRSYSDTTGGPVHQMAFSENGNIWYRRGPYATGFETWRKVWDNGNLTNLNQLTNGPGYITGTSSITGNAATSTALATPRTIGISGAITGTATAFDGSGNITVPVTALNVGDAAVTGSLKTTNGGTGLSAFTTGDLLYASAANVLSRLSAGTAGQVLTMVSGAPAWAAATGGGGGSGARFTVDDTAPTSPTPAVGDWWLRPADGVLSVLVPTAGAGNVWHVPIGASGNSVLPAGTTGSLQYNNGTTLSGAANVSIENGSLRMTTITEPAAPASGGLAVYSRGYGGRSMLTQKDSSGYNVTMQPHMARNRISAWQGGTGAAPILFGTSTALTLTGTGTAAAVATTNRQTQMLRTELLVTTAATTAVCGFRAAANQFFLGGADGTGNDGGFHFVCRWGPATGVATTTTRAFVGLSGIATGTAPTDVNPSTILNQFGMGWDAADTNIQLMYNGASGTATKVNLGASFPIPRTDRTKAYEIALYCPPGFAGAAVFYEIQDLSTGALASGSILNSSGKLPTTTTLLAPRGWMSVGGTSSVIGMALMSCYVETDN